MSNIHSTAGKRAFAFSGLRKGKDDEGFTLAEILVSLGIFVLVVVILSGMLIATMRTGRNNKMRVAAANLASAEIEKVRAVDPRVITDGLTTTTQVLNGTPYKVTRSVTFDDLTGAGSTCDSVGTGYSYRKISIEVSWPNMNGVKPVRSDIVRSLPLTSLDTSKGSLAIPVKASDGLGQKGITVDLSGTNIPGGKSLDTGNDGCVVFTNLVPADDYTATINETGFVDGAGSQAVVRSGLEVIGGQVNKDNGFVYDKNAILDIRIPAAAVGYPALKDIAVTLTHSNFSGGRQAFPRCTNIKKENCSVDHANGGGKIQVQPSDKEAYLIYPGICADGVIPGTANPGTQPDQGVLVTKPGTTPINHASKVGPLEAVYVQFVNSSGTLVKPPTGKKLQIWHEPGCDSVFENVEVSYGHNYKQFGIPAGNWRVGFGTTLAEAKNKGGTKLFAEVNGIVNVIKVRV